MERNEVHFRSRNNRNRNIETRAVPGWYYRTWGYSSWLAHMPRIESEAAAVATRAPRRRWRRAVPPRPCFSAAFRLPLWAGRGQEGCFFAAGLMAQVCFWSATFVGHDGSVDNHLEHNIGRGNAPSLGGLLCLHDCACWIQKRIPSRSPRRPRHRSLKLHLYSLPPIVSPFGIIQWCLPATGAKREANDRFESKTGR